MTAGRIKSSQGQKEVKSVGKAIDLVFAFTRERPSMTVDEISEELALPRSTVYRFVATLRDKGVIVQQPGADRYMLGVRLLQLGDVIRLSTGLRGTALPFMQRLGRLSRETVVLVVQTDGQATYLEMIESPEPMRVIPSDGMSFPLHCGATRRVLLAHMGPADQERYLRGRLKRYTPATIVDKETLRLDLAAILKRGYATSDQEIYPGARSLAAPVRDANDRVVASVGIVGPVQRLSDERVRELLPGVLECAEGISVALGARARPGTSAPGAHGPRRKRPAALGSETNLPSSR